MGEGYPDSRILVTGNTVIDALHMVAAMPYDWSGGPLAGIPQDKRLVLVTAHRRESFGKPLAGSLYGNSSLGGTYAADGVHFVYPVHPNPNVRGPVAEILSANENVSLLDPLDYLSLVATYGCRPGRDRFGRHSGRGAGLGIPVLVTRERTERPEGLAGGCRETGRHLLRADPDGVDGNSRRPGCPRGHGAGCEPLWRRQGRPADRIGSAIGQLT